MRKPTALRSCPSGFFGGVNLYGGDPELAIVLVPIGGLLLTAAILLTALTVGRNDR